MAICRFYQQGTCKFGASCRNDHIDANTQPQTSNRFGPLSGGTSSAMGGQADIPYHLSKDMIQRDLAEERPSWILSAYGPGKDAPEQLFGGFPREQSVEEIRLHYLMGKMSGKEQGAINEIEALNQTALQQIQTALGNLDGAIQFIVAAGEKHPNRRDVCQQATQPGGTTGEFLVGKPRNPAFGGQPAAGAFGSSSSGAFGAPSQPANPFGAPSQPAAGGFGQPAALGQKPNPFGQPSAAAATPAFGQPSQPVSAFGQSSALGAKPNPFGSGAFGQPPQPAAASAFSQASQAAQASAFGQPSQPAGAPAFGQPSQPGSAPAFGQPSLPNTGFGQSSALGQKPNPWGAPAGGAGASPFGGAAAQQPAKPNPFGQPSQPQQNASPFGQAAPAQPAASPFGQPQPAAQASPFGQQPAAQASPFGQQPAAQSSPFGQQQQQPAQSSPFGQQPQQPAAANPFGSSSTPAAASNPFGAKPTTAANPFGAAPPAASNPFGQPQPQQQTNGAAATASAAAPGEEQNPYPPTSSRQHAKLSTYSTRDPSTGRLVAFKGKQVGYHRQSEDKPPIPVLQSFDGSLEKIWFPDGPPAYNEDTEVEDKRVYRNPEVLSAWGAFVTTGKFPGDVMPEVPPLREFCTWDF
ncbi:hypothetical protein GE09DRAFT_1135439 [Coniochaeta sp. 2T2.1]|nr:hypothetical protein GE09DRAFT_1135439 [Coniochaeta sp. 2T2.1]